MIFEDIIDRTEGSYTNIANVEPFSHYSLLSLQAIALEDKIVVSFTYLHNFLKWMQIVVFLIEGKNFAVPIHLGFRKIEIYSLPNSILEAHNEIFSKIAQSTIKSKLLRNTAITIFIEN